MYHINFCGMQIHMFGITRRPTLPKMRNSILGSTVKLAQFLIYVCYSCMTAV